MLAVENHVLGNNVFTFEDVVYKQYSYGHPHDPHYRKSRDGFAGGKAP